MLAVVPIVVLVGKFLPDLGEPVPFALWRPSRPTLDQALRAAIRHRTSPASLRRLRKWLFPGNSRKH